MQDFSHIIETGKDGVLENVTPRSHVEEIFKQAMLSGKPLVLHLHGGLVSKEDAYAKVNNLQKRYTDNGLFPIFVVWHTSIFDAIKNANELVNRPLFQQILIRLLKYFVAKYGGGAIVGGRALSPGEEPDGAEIEAELAKRRVGGIPYEDVKPQPAADEMSESDKTDLLISVAGDDDLRQDWLREVEAPESLPGGKSLQIDDDILSEAHEEFAKPEGRAILSGALLARHMVLIAGRVIYRFFHHRDHGLHTTIVEEILRQFYVDALGTEVWQFMKQDSADTFLNEGQLPERGGWLFMSLLGQEVKQRLAEGKALPSLSIVGHSAGTIYASHLLGYLYQARLNPASSWHGIPYQLDKLVFLAPAATCQVFASALEKHEQSPLFRSFRMYSLSDATEKGYYEIPVLYPGSLLYIISGLLETVDDGGSADMPITGMQRYGRTSYPFTEPEVQKVWTFLRSKPHQLVWSGDQNGPGLNCDAAKHGLFDCAPATVESFLYFLK